MAHNESELNINVHKTWKYPYFNQTPQTKHNQGKTHNAIIIIKKKLDVMQKHHNY